jgi:hypothetical protein
MSDRSIAPRANEKVIRHREVGQKQIGVFASGARIQFFSYAKGSAAPNQADELWPAEAT